MSVVSRILVVASAAVVLPAAASAQAFYPQGGQVGNQLGYFGTQPNNIVNPYQQGMAGGVSPTQQMIQQQQPAQVQQLPLAAQAPSYTPKPAPTSTSTGTAGVKNARGQIIEGVATVIDGDTFYVDQQIVVLYGADAPEIDQTCEARRTPWRCGIRAKEELARLIEGKFVSCIGQRQTGDAVAAVCTVPTGDVGEMMVRAGMAVVPYELSKAYMGAQEFAKASARGVWQGPFIVPWEFRAKTNHVHVVR